MQNTEYKTRGGNAAFFIGHGPLTRTFHLFEVEGARYLVWAHDNRYRFDDEDHPLDILKIE